jgi:hypothetical protein
MRIVKWLVSGVLLALSVSALIPVAAGQTASSAAKTGDARSEDEVRRLSAEEVQAFLNRDSKTLARLWSDDFVVTNPLNQFVTKQQVLGMVEAGVLVITSFERQIDYAKVYRDTVIVAERETVIWGGKMPNVGRGPEPYACLFWPERRARLTQLRPARDTCNNCAAYGVHTAVGSVDRHPTDITCLSKDFGARWWIRTTDPRRVKAVLYR